MKPVHHSIRIAILGLLLLMLGGSASAQRLASLPDLCGSRPLGPGLRPGEKGMVDRFNYPWRPSPKLIRYAASGRRLQSADCGGFHVDFEDVVEANGRGFDDRTPVVHPLLGVTTLGAVRQRTVCEVFSYIGGVIEVKGTPDVIVQASESDGSGYLAAAGPFFFNSVPNFVGGTMYDHITTGIDPTPSPGSYDAQIVYDFGPWSHNGVPLPINSDWNTPAGNMIDLYSITLHEITHTLGFMSLIDPDGASVIGGGYAFFDKRMQDASGRPLINPVTVKFQGSAADLLSNTLIFHGEHCDEVSPVYSPGSYQTGSSLSHFDMNRSGIRYVMRPSTAGGDDRKYTEPELQVLCDLGYSLRGGVCANCSPRGVEDLGATTPGVEVCIDVLANDLNPGGGTLSIDPASVTIDVGAGSFRINGSQICFTPSTGFAGVARLHYSPTNGVRPGNPTLVRVNVNKPAPLSKLKTYNIWYFGTKVGLAFGTGIPTPLDDGQLSTLEGCATECDPNSGRLLFYTDGVTVWDATHQVMPNGVDLKGHWTSCQSALVVPKPGDPNIYYIFTTGAGPYAPGTPNTGMRYSVVDLRLNGGRGDVTDKNVTLMDLSTEQLTATRHCNGVDYWVVGHEWGTNNFRAYRVGADGVSAPVITPVGELYPSDLSNPVVTGRFCQGSMKFSPSGRKLGVVASYLHIADVYDFDIATGVVSNQLVLTNRTNYLYYSASFSPDNSKLYISTLSDPNAGNPDAIMQFDLSSGDPNTIQSSLYTLPINVHGGWTGGQVQLAPDGKVYAAILGETYLRVINDPDKPGIACNFVEQGLALGGKSSQHGLPNCIDAQIFGTPCNVTSSFELGLSKHVDNATPNYGDTITYTITVCNPALTDVSDVEIEDILPSGVQYVDGMSSYPHHTFDLIKAGECRSIRVRAIAMNTLPVNTPIRNCATVTRSTPPVGAIPLDSNCVDITVPGTDIAIKKKVSVDTALAGDQISYTITVTNLGPGSGTNIVVTDKLPAGVTYLSHSSTCAGGSYDPVSGLLSIPALGVGDICTLTVICTINPDAVFPIVNCAGLSGLDQMDLDVTNNFSCAPVESGACHELPGVQPLEFGEISWCVDSTAIVTLRNNCLSSVELRAILPPAGGSFDIDAISLPVVIGPGGYLNVRVRFHPSSAGSWTDSVRYVMVLSDKGAEEIDTLTQMLHGTGIGLHAVAEIAQGYSAFPGHPVRTAVMLLHALDMARVRHLTITVGFDSSCAMLNNGADTAGLLSGGLLEGWIVESMVRSRGHLSITLRSPADSIYLRGTGMLLNPEMEIFLAGDNYSDLKLGVAALDVPCVAMESASGWIRLDSVCGLNLRLIERTVGTKLSLNEIRPNPFSDYVDIGFSTIFDAPARLRITDAAGRTVATLVDGEIPAGEHEIRWDARALSSGLYYCQLDAGEKTLVARLVLVK